MEHDSKVSSQKIAFVAAHKYLNNDFFSPDIDVLVLVIANYDQLPRDTSNPTSQAILDMFRRTEKAKALLAFHLIILESIIMQINIAQDIY